jgi:flavodoxin
MKTLVVFYSRDGLTKKIAAELAGLLQAETEELVDLKGRQGLWGWFLAGGDAFRKKLTRITGSAKDPAAYDLVVLGSPIWAGSITPAARTFLSESSHQIKRAAFFCTKGGTSSQKFFLEMEQLSGQKPLAILDIKRGEDLSGAATHKMIRFVDEIKRNS